MECKQHRLNVGVELADVNLHAEPGIHSTKPLRTETKISIRKTKWQHKIQYPP